MMMKRSVDSTLLQVKARLVKMTTPCNQTVHSIIQRYWEINWSPNPIRLVYALLIFKDFYIPLVKGI